MGVHVLVTYGTKHGATKEIAEKIGQDCRKVGLQWMCRMPGTS
jgi:menaquinone-dependent protoporphyrinogen IX oxidase